MELNRKSSGCPGAANTATPGQLISGYTRSMADYLSHALIYGMNGLP
jgi:hypothetical protein